MKKSKPKSIFIFCLMAEALRNQKEDVPYDSKDPLYKFSMG